MGRRLPRPKRETEDEVVPARDDWEALCALAEDADDLAAVAAARAEDAAFAAGLGEGIETTIPCRS